MQDVPQPQPSGSFEKNKDYSQVLAGTQHDQGPHSEVMVSEMERELGALFLLG